MAGQRDVCIQLTADTELALARAVVEIAELIRTGSLPLTIGQLYRGFHRDDRRSWIGFHDGINNLSAEDRMDAIVVEREPDTPWLDGGCFLAFFKLEIDLALWRAIPRTTQEAIVGRSKLSGVPLADIRVDAAGEITVRPDATCPMRAEGPLPSVDPGNCVDPSVMGNAGLEVSHIGRSNLIRGAARENANNRIYRQGYEFFDLGANGRVSVGLNFVAFVRRLDAVRDILRQSRWLSDANFGGGSLGIPSPSVMKILSGGFYAVPPSATSSEVFPGAGIFEPPLAV